MILRLHPSHGCWASGEVNGTLAVRSPAALLWRQQQAHQGCISALEWSPGGNWLASGGRDGQVHVWHAATGERLGTFLHGEKVGLLCWSPESASLTAASRQTIHVWPLTCLALSSPVL